MDETLTKTSRVAEARHAARALLRSAKITSAPVQLRDILRHVSPVFNLTVQGTKALPRGVDAVLHKDAEIAIIGYSENVAIVRQRFSVAHELGHLHMGHVHGQSSSDLNSEDFDEVEANQFAAHLLMPQSFLAADIKSGLKDVASLAKRYQVSEDAMWWQLSKTGLINKL